MKWINTKNNNKINKSFKKNTILTNVCTGLWVAMWQCVRLWTNIFVRWNGLPTIALTFIISTFNTVYTRQQFSQPRSFVECCRGCGGDNGETAVLTNLARWPLFLKNKMFWLRIFSWNIYYCQRVKAMLMHYYIMRLCPYCYPNASHL